MCLQSVQQILDDSHSLHSLPSRHMIGFLFFWYRTDNMNCGTRLLQQQVQNFTIDILLPYCLRIAVALTFASAWISRHCTTGSIVLVPLCICWISHLNEVVDLLIFPQSFTFLNDIKVVVSLVYLVKISLHCE